MEQFSKQFLSKVYGWMAGALCITGIVAFIISNILLANPSVLTGYTILWWICAIVGLGLVYVIVIGANIHKMSFKKAASLYIGYSILNGITLSTLLLCYTSISIASVFLITAGLFLCLSLIGYFIKIDLTKFGHILLVLLFGLLFGLFINKFWTNSLLYTILTFAGIIIFIGLTVYDTQKIKKESYNLNNTDNEMNNKLSIYFALDIYLDFIILLFY